MARRKTIKIRGVRGKRHTKFPFFANSKERKEVAYSRMVFRLKLKKRREEKSSIDRTNMPHD